MTFDEVLPLLQAGKKVRRETWVVGYYLHLHEDGVVVTYYPDSTWTEDGLLNISRDLLAADWQVVEEDE